MTYEEATAAFRDGVSVVFCHPWFTRGEAQRFSHIVAVIQKQGQYGQCINTAILYVSERCMQHVDIKYLKIEKR